MSRVSVLSDPFLPDSREEQGDFAGSHLGGAEGRGRKRDEGKTFLGSARYQIQLCGVDRRSAGGQRTDVCVVGERLEEQALKRGLEAMKRLFLNINIRV